MSRFVIAITCLFCGLFTGCASPTPNAQIFATQTEQQVQLIDSVEGVDLFRQYCASCHGLDAKGSGIMASALKTKVADLTVLAKNNRRQFPAARVIRRWSLTVRVRCRFGDQSSIKLSGIWIGETSA
jgi:hypothetical protein